MGDDKPLFSDVILEMTLLCEMGMLTYIDRSLLTMLLVVAVLLLGFCSKMMSPR